VQRLKPRKDNLVNFILGTSEAGDSNGVPANSFPAARNTSASRQKCRAAGMAAHGFITPSDAPVNAKASIKTTPILSF